MAPNNSSLGRDEQWSAHDLAGMDSRQWFGILRRVDAIRSQRGVGSGGGLDDDDSCQVRVVGS